MNQRITCLLLAPLLLLRASARDPTPLDQILSGQIQLQFHVSDVREVLAFYEYITEYKIITDDKIGGPITIAANQNLTKEQAIAFIEQGLFAHGFSTIQQARDTIRIVSPGNNPRLAGMPHITKPEDLPTAERRISYTLKLQHRDPAELRSVLLQHVAWSPALGNSLVVDSESHSLIATERSSIIRDLIKLVKEIDVPRNP